MPEPIRCNVAEMEAHWRPAMWARAALIVTRDDGTEDVYHPPYPYPDRLVEWLARCPGATVGAIHTTPAWMREAANEYDEKHPWRAGERPARRVVD